MDYVNKKVCSDDPPIFSSTSYNDARWYFLEDYDRANPATEELATRQFTEARKTAFVQKVFQPMQ